MIITRWKRGFFFFLSGGGYLFHSRGVLLSASPARWGCTPAIFFSFFFRWWKQKSCLQTSCFGWWIIAVVAAWFVKSLRLTSLHAPKRDCWRRLACVSHKAKSWRPMYISWPASRSPFSLKTSGLTHAQNQPPFVQPLQTVLIVLISVSSTFAVRFLFS